ncbi:hypothetical protein BJY52DRAFT_1365350 [Lactarius psammicola]|nr:hypothetical protein BJY52DRAFT_1365350 [Lactarius psammicola]
MYFSPVLVLAALPFLAAVAPFKESSRDWISIPIAKRSNTRDLSDYNDDLCRKLLRSFKAFERNTGIAHPSTSRLKRSINDLVLPVSNCDSTCSGHTLYDPSYGDGNAVSAEQYGDTVTLAGYKVNLSHGIHSLVIDGSLPGYSAETQYGHDLL